ncbi:endonuclease/exonuclease/phosphatase family protein [uncultured Arcticibacterium sp.]|uniref:endonuclease/exonuclease/phosphatase family protein n=1 Tax=uncultured Arcticibacterium sp. TaxID=2173042 RepID=UPI0030FC84CB
MLLRILLLLLPISCLSQSSLNVMSFNIRYATPNDGINQWENRKEHVAETISYFETDICGLQEATEPQVLFLGEALSNYKWVGVGRDDGKAGGEFSPIFYNSSKLALTSWNTVWLSKTPEKPSKDWDAALPRIATVAHFIRKSDGKAFVAINTHYDHRGDLARVESSKLLLALIAKMKDPVILMGDFNSTPTDEPILIYTNGGLKNTQDVSKTPHYGPIDSFTGFKSSERENSQIDHIFINSGITVLKHAAISQTWGGLFASDHHPILTTLKF